MEASEAPKFGIAFDIDGVLVKSGSAIEEAKDAMKKLIELCVCVHKDAAYKVSQ